MRLESLRVINDRQRNSSVDIFRAFAIIAVVLYHFYFGLILPYGHLGVDLFFVVSGLLVGGLITKDYVRDRRISFPKFILQRGFKIWPSYYTFLILGNILAYLLYRNWGPDEYIQLWDMKRYLLFYQNYTGAPFHRTFDGVWSLCVEEHFYILLPIALIVLQKFRTHKKGLFISAILIIIAGFVFKILSLYVTRSKETVHGTHNCIDALGLGFLLNLLLTYYPQWFKKGYKNLLLFVCGAALLAVNLAINILGNSLFYDKVMLHTLTGVSCFLMLAGLYRYDFSRLKWLQFIAYYSYNWYLWHPIVRPATEHYFGRTVYGFLIYLVGSFALAVLFTVIIEEPFLRLRKRVIPKLFPNKKGAFLRKGYPETKTNSV